MVSLVLRTARLGVANWEGSPTRIVGLVSYVAIESYGSLAVALFWSFTNATVTLNGAKASYGLIIAGAQIGAIIGEVPGNGRGLKASIYLRCQCRRDRVMDNDKCAKKNVSYWQTVTQAVMEALGSSPKQFHPMFVYYHKFFGVTSRLDSNPGDGSRI